MSDIAKESSNDAAAGALIALSITADVIMNINKKSRRTYGGDSHLSALQKKEQMQIERIKLMQLLQGN